ncbi:hypothetical protein [Streptomyces alkaliphilus]|uniref:hypothetical protein n=1 Tax=Streptomyces alkaliphilus TaxID=1472722 RepID=UPI00117C644D|nr:hypothetical protein [Streptomyces alkaliphilus]MQS08519.1 hypothetical protein [Streptomyces alkaliphilus]
MFAVLWIMAWAVWGLSLIWSLVVVLRLWVRDEWQQSRWWRHLRSICLFGTVTAWGAGLFNEGTRCPAPPGIGIGSLPPAEKWAEVEWAFPVVVTCDGGPNLVPLWLNALLVLFALGTVVTVNGSILLNRDRRWRTYRVL